MSRIYDQLTLPETRSEPEKVVRAPISQRAATEEQLHLVTAERGEQDRQLRIDELANQARLHVAAIERAHKRTTEEVRLAAEHSVQLAEEARLELLARERAEAEQEERCALVARVEAERQLTAQLEMRIEQEKIERAQAAQRAAQEEQLRRVIAEREEHERLLQAEESAAQIRLYEAAIEEARRQAEEEVREAERLAAQLKEEKRLEALSRERAQAEEDERMALASRIEAERQLTAQIEVRIEQEKIERAQASKRILHEEQLRIAVAAREAQERQLRIEESAAQAESQAAAIEEARKRTADEMRRAEELAAQREEEARLEELAWERTQIEQSERAALAGRIEAERQLTAQIEARIEQERLELEQVSLRDANEEKLRLAIAEREAMESRLQVEELAAKAQRHEAPIEAAQKSGIGNVRGAENRTVRFVEELRLPAIERPLPLKEQAAGIPLKRIQVTSRHGQERASERVSSLRLPFPVLNRRYFGYLAVALLVIGGIYFMAGGSRNIDNKPSAVAVRSGGEAAPVSVKVNPPPAPEIPVVAPQIKANITSIPEITATPVPPLAPAVAAVPEIKATVAPVPKMNAALDQVGQAAKSQQRGEKEIRRSVMQWAEAWSRRDAVSYLSFYATDFIPPEGMRRADWEEQRKSRLGKYRSIKVTLRNIKINYLGGNAASVSFAQDFRADNHMEIRTKKDLGLKNTQGHWLIVSEKNS